MKRNDPILAIIPKATRLKVPDNPRETLWYCDSDEGLPGQRPPDGYYLVHNHVRPVRPIGLNGFRAWVQDTAVQSECLAYLTKPVSTRSLIEQIERASAS